MRKRLQGCVCILAWASFCNGGLWHRGFSHFTYTGACGLSTSERGPSTKAVTGALASEGVSAVVEVSHEPRGSPCAKKKFPTLRFEGAWKQQETIQEWQHQEMTPSQLQRQLLGDPSSYIPLAKSFVMTPETWVKRPGR